MRGAEAERAEHEHQMKKLILEAKPDRFGIGLAQSGGGLPDEPIQLGERNRLVTGDNGGRRRLAPGKL
jgi:hypothetical protein